MFSILRAVLIATGMGAVGSFSAAASDIVLTIDGEIGAGAPISMTVEDLEAIGSTTIVTKTP